MYTVWAFIICFPGRAGSERDVEVYGFLELQSFYLPNAAGQAAEVVPRPWNFRSFEVAKFSLPAESRVRVFGFSKWLDKPPNSSDGLVAIRDVFLSPSTTCGMITSSDLRSTPSIFAEYLRYLQCTRCLGWFKNNGIDRSGESPQIPTHS